MLHLEAADEICAKPLYTAILALDNKWDCARYDDRDGDSAQMAVSAHLDRARLLEDIKVRMSLTRHGMVDGHSDTVRASKDVLGHVHPTRVALCLIIRDGVTVKLRNC